mgnify:CR=1 FL=1
MGNIVDIAKDLRRDLIGTNTNPKIKKMGASITKEGPRYSPSQGLAHVAIPRASALARKYIIETSTI